MTSHPSPSFDSATFPSISVSNPVISDGPVVQGQQENRENVTSQLAQSASAQLATYHPSLRTATPSTSQMGLPTPTTPSNIFPPLDFQQKNGQNVTSQLAQSASAQLATYHSTLRTTIPSASQLSPPTPTAPSNISPPLGFVGSDIWASWQERLESIKSENCCYITSSRLALLSDAFSYRDIFYLVLHQLFCLSDSSGTIDVRITTRFPTLALDHCRTGMKLLRRFLEDNTKIEPSILFLFTHIPETVNMLLRNMPSWYSHVMNEVSLFLSSLVTKFHMYQIHEKAMRRRYPPLRNELRALLNTNSPVMINVVFMAVCRKLYDANFQTKILALYKRYLLLEDNAANTEALIRQYITIPIMTTPDQMDQPRRLVAHTAQQQIQDNRSQYEQLSPLPHPNTQILPLPHSAWAPGVQLSHELPSVSSNPVLNMGMYPHPDRAGEWVLLPTMWASQETARFGSYLRHPDGKYHHINLTYERSPSGHFLLKSQSLSPTAPGIPRVRPHPVFESFASTALPQASMNQNPSTAPLSHTALVSQPPPAMEATNRDGRGNLGHGMVSHTISGMVQPNAMLHMNSQTVASKIVTPVCQSSQVAPSSFQTPKPGPVRQTAPLAPPPSLRSQQSLVSQRPAITKFMPPSGYRAPHTAQPNPTHLALHQLDLAEPMKIMMLEGQGDVEEPTSLYCFPYSLAMEPAFFHREKTNQTLTFMISPQDALTFPRVAMSKGIPIIKYKARCLSFHLRCISVRPSEKDSLHSSWSTMATCWPSVFYVIVNGIEMFVRRRVHNEKDLPLDITQHLHEGENKISIKMILDQKECKNREYAFVIQSMAVASFDRVCELVKVFPRDKFIEEVNRRLNQSSADDDLAVVSNSLTVNLIDPLTQKIFTGPGRSIDCQHLECFDVESFILTKRCLSGNDPLKDNWRCPICKADARPIKLVHDEFFKEVRAKLIETKKLEGAQTIEIKTNGVWSVNYATRDIVPPLQTSNAPKERIVIELDD